MSACTQKSQNAPAPTSRAVQPSTSPSFAAQPRFAPVVTTMPTTSEVQATTVIKFSKESTTRIMAGTQTSTTRTGIRHYPLGPAIAQSTDGRISIVITQLHYCKFSELTETDAKTDGLASLDDLKQSLQKSYPNVQESDDMTTVYFHLAQAASASQ